MSGSDAVAVRRARVAVTAIFAMQGMLFASWTAHIPSVQHTLGADDGQLGTALLGAPVGSVLAMLLVGRLIPRFGSRAVTRAGIAGYGCAGLLVGLAHSLPGLFAALFVWGAFQGGLDVAMNAHGTEVERAHGGAIMSGFHGFWSIGALTGALVGTAAAGLGVGLDAQLVVLGVLAAGAAALVSVWLLPPARAVEEHAPTRPSGTVRRLPRTALLLGAIAFASMLCEGATADWSAVYIHQLSPSATSSAGLGYTSYALAMVVVRLLAARLFARVAPSRMIPVLCLVATAGMTIGLASGTVVWTLAGFAALGLGLATVVPTAFSAAGRIPVGDPGSNIALVSALGWAGFVCGPPLIGHLSELAGLSLALGVVPLLTLAITILVATVGVFPKYPVSRTADADQTAHLVVDFGGVISLPQPEGIVADLADLAAVDRDAFARRYWEHRADYDRGMSAETYWQTVAAKGLDAEQIRACAQRDVASWTRLNRGTLHVLERAHEMGVDLILLSNAPHPQADLVERMPEIRRLFDRLVFSARMGIAKPDPRIYRQTALKLGDQGQIVLVDDNNDNLAAAARAGWATIPFASPELLARQLAAAFGEPPSAS